MAPVVAVGISTGTMALVGGLVLAVGAVYYLSKSDGQTDSKEREKKRPTNKLLSDDNRYNGDKAVIEDAIQEKDWETLEDMLDSATQDFPDLVEMIEKSLKSR